MPLEIFKALIGVIVKKNVVRVMKQLKRVAVQPENCVGCLTCQLVCSFTYTDRFNPSAARIIVEWSPEGSKISFTDECVDCGICADYCFYDCLTRVKEEK